MSSPAQHTSLELWLLNLTAEVLNLDVEDLDLSKSFLASGGDSLSAIEFMAKCREHQVTIEISDVIALPTLSQLIERIVQEQQIEITADKQDILENRIQNGNSNGEAQPSQTVSMKLNRRISTSAVQAALDIIIHQHQALQSAAIDGSAARWLFEQVLEGVEDDGAAAIDELCEKLDLEHGFIFGAVLYSPVDQTQTLVLVAHRAVVDHTSWRIIIRDLTIALQDTNGSELLPDADFTNLISINCPASDTPDEQFTKRSREPDDVIISLDESTTNMILRDDLHKVFRTTASDIINTVLLLTAHDMGLANGSTMIRHVINRRHQHPELSDAVGCFDENISFEMVPPVEKSVLQALRNVKDVVTKSKSRPEMLHSKSHEKHNIVGDEDTSPAPVHALYMEVQSTDTFQIRRPESSDIEILPSVGWTNLPPSDITVVAEHTIQVLIHIWEGKLRWLLRMDKLISQEFAYHIQKNITRLLNELKQAPRMASLSDFPLLNSSYTALDSLFANLQSVKPDALEAVQAIGPCSPMQDNFLISQKLNPQAYQCQFSLRVASISSNDKLDAEIIAACWAQIMARHSILRTTFVESDTRLGKFDQVVWKHIEPWVVVHYEGNAFLDDREFPTYAMYRPPHRLSVSSDPKGGVYVKLDISHALVDGQSTEVLLRDFSNAYRGMLPKSEEALPYIDFTAYELSLDTRQTSDYWSRYMGKAQASYLPVNNNISLSGFQNIQTQVNLPSGQLDSFCGQYGVTPVNVCQVAWGLVLRSFANSDDVCFSYVTSRRQTPLPGIQAAIGLFIDALLCRLQLKGDIRVIEVLGLVADEFMSSLPYQDITMALSRDSRGSSIRRWGNSVLSFHRALPTSEYEKSGFIFEPLARITPTDYDVSLNIDIEHDSLRIDFDFWESKMDHSLANGILNVFQEAITFVLQSADETIHAFTPLTEADRKDLRRLDELQFLRSDVCIHDLVQNISVCYPNHPAVCAWDGDWTYDELVASATALSYKLVTEENVRPGAMVGICMEKSKWVITAMMAVLKSGATVVPIGIDDPRAEELLQSANIALILTSPIPYKKLQVMDLRILLVDAQNATALPQLNEPWGQSVAPNDVAWLLYTSGSSGKPKGVLLEHAALGTALLAQGKAFEIGPGVRTLQFAAYTFADSITDIFSTLVMGGCVCVPSEEGRTTDLAASMHELRVNQATLTSTVAGLLLEPTEAPPLRRLILSGEKPSTAVITKWMPHTEIINGYGQSEAAIFASMSQPITDPADASNIGLPIAGRFWVVRPGDYNSLCPVGGPGELLIESPALARGYLNDVERTSSAFVEDPAFVRELGIHSDDPRRMYRTGDLVRQDGSSGAYLFMGRQDTQVKIRGQRVELGEVENAVTTLLPDNIEAVAVSLVKFGEDNEPTLVAALEVASSVVLSRGREDIRPLDATELQGIKGNLETLQNALLGKLPVYMVPTFFVPMTRLPVNASKKIDRRVLTYVLETMDPALIKDLTLVDATQQQPSTEAERKLQSLWAAAFGRPLESISIRENFFQSGGDSVTAIRMVAAARNSGLTLTVADIFTHPRIQDLANVLTNTNDSQLKIVEDEPLPFSMWVGEGELQYLAAQCAIGVSQIEDVYPTTPLQEGLMAVTTQRLREDAYVMQRVYRLPSSVSLAELRVAWEKLVACTPILRTRIALTQQGVAIQVVVSEAVNWRTANAASLPDYLQQDSSRPTEYGRPLSRVAIIDTDKSGDGYRYFVWTIHHCLYDGWSTVKTLNLLAQLWDGQPPPPSLVPMSRFIRYLSRQDESSVRQFWLRHLEGAIKTRFPPLVDNLYQPLPMQLVERQIVMKNRRKGLVTTSTLLRATWAMILASYSGENEAVMTVTLSGRNASMQGIVDMIAPTVTSVPFRVPISRQQSIDEFLKDVQKRASDMIPFEHTGLQHIRRFVPGLGADFDPGHVFTIQTSSESGQDPLVGKLERIGSDRDGLQSYAFTLDCITDQEKDIITLEARFDDTILPTAQVESILSQFASVFRQLEEYSDTSNRIHGVIGNIDMISKEDMARIREWHSPRKPSSPKRCLHHLFEKAAVLSPGATAVSAWDGDLTYGELNREASRLAKYLIESGVQEDTSVNVCMSKARYTIVAIMAILKAGGAVVPLGVHDSLENIEAILDDANNDSRFESNIPPFILTDRAQDKRLSKLRRTFHSVVVDDETLNSLPLADGMIEAAVGKGHAAFVLYTTGMDAGQRQAIVLEHGALSLNISSRQPLFDFGPETRTLQLAPLVSGAAIEDIFTTLSFGGCLCLPSEDVHINELSSFIRRFDVNVASITPSLAALLDPIDTPSLKKISIGGENTASPAVIQKWLKHSSIRNTYVLIESGLTFSYSPLLTNPQEASEIGTPAVKGAFWVVLPDDNIKLSPVGAVGELLIENPLLVPGYMNEMPIVEPAFLQVPELALEPDSENQRCLYKTGDLVRQNHDGSFSLVSRRVERKGVCAQRGELSEIIEHEINAHSHVQATVVLRLTGGKHSDIIVALIVLRDFGFATEKQDADVHELPLSDRLDAMRQVWAIKADVAQQLPEDLIPSIWIPLAAFPVTEALDRTNVSVLSKWLIGMPPEVAADYLKFGQQGDGDGEYDATTVEQDLRQIWSEALNIPIVDIPFNRPFLALGGDSITAIRIVTLSRAKGIQISLRNVIQSQGIVDLASQSTLAEGKPATQIPVKKTLELTPRDIETLSRPPNGMNIDDIEDVLPCSPIQQGILLSQLRLPTSYRIFQTFRLRSADSTQQVDVQRLVQAWRLLLTRHSIMRTVFVESLPGQDGFHQIVLKSPEANIEVETCYEEHDAVQRLATVTPLKEIYGNPSHRLTILQTTDGIVYGHIEANHALADAASFGIFTHELLDAYDSVPFSTPGSTYGTYVAYLRQQPAEEDMRFWTSLLADASPCVLPPLGPQDTMIGNENTGDVLIISTVLSDLSSLRHFQSSQGITIASVFELAWALILSFYTGSNRVCWGGLLNSRDVPLADANLMIGPMINQIIHFVPLNMESTVGDAARNVQQQLLDAFEHQRSSLADIQHELKQTDETLFNTIMSVRRKNEMGNINNRSLVLEPISTTDPTDYDITLHVLTSDHEIEVTLHTRPEFTGSASANNLLEHFLEVVKALVKNPNWQLKELATLSKRDTARVQSWNRNIAPEEQTCVHQIIQQRLQLQPDKIVVDAWDGTLTSQELDKASSVLAEYLIASAGVSPNSLVGFCMSKSKWAIVAMLGILKSGGAVVPFGVRDPPGRIKGMVQNSGARVIVADWEQISRLGSLEEQGVRFINVEDVYSYHDEHHLDTSMLQDTKVASHNIAFVMYTSGSTGSPKGVMVHHGALCTSMKLWAELPGSGLGPNARVCQFTAFTFDPANHDILTTLYSGGCICVPSEDDRLSNLEKFICDFQVTAATLTPTVSRMLTPKKMPSLRYLILAGEALKPSDVEPWIECGSTQVVNGYGPTECTIIVSMSVPVVSKYEASNIGYPLGSAFWITQPNNYDSLCPVGMAGELLVEGPTVATGYLHNPQATEASFIVDPAFIRQLGMKRGRRMYRTGDIVKQNENGSITFIGRRDEQIKVRGQRVEAIEIESSILQMNTDIVRVAYAGLIKPHNENNESIIIAAVELRSAVSSENENPIIFSPQSSILLELNQLRRSLLAVMPSYMVPSAIIPFSRMPLSSAGKVDRPTVHRILSNLSEADINNFINVGSAISKKPPSTPMERLLQDLWATVLQKAPETISSEDDFFQIGGDSISAMKLVAAARQGQTQVSLTVANIFQNPRLSQLAHVVSVDETSIPATVADAEPFSLSFRQTSVRANQIATLAAQCNVSVEDIEDAYPCSPLQEGLIAITTQRPDKYVLRRVFSVNGDVAYFKSLWDRLWKSLTILRTRIVPWETGAVQVIVREPIQWHHASSLQTYLEEDRSIPMTYGSKLCRLSIIETPGNEKIHFVWTIHHSIYDGWSMLKTLDMLTRLSRNESIPRPVPMSRFIRYLMARDEDSTNRFWREHLGSANVIKFPELPIDPSYLPQSTQYSRRQITRRNDEIGSVTTSNVLRAAWAILLAAYAGTDASEAIIMVALSGRQAPVEGIEDIIAPIVATVPVRVQIPQGDSIPAFLSRVQQDAVDMIPYEHTGLQNIRRHVPELDDGLFTPAHLFTVQTAIEADNGRVLSADNLLSIEAESETDDAIQGYAFNLECTIVTDKRIDVSIWFDETTISIPQVHRVLEQFENIFRQLSQFSNDETRLVRDLDLISPQDKAQIISWNETVPERTNKCIHEILQDISKRQPDAPAVCAWDGDLTYRELVQMASRLAHRLRHLDSELGPESLVGFCIPKSKWAIVAAVAILQAGAGVVPLGIQHPLARIQTIVENTKARFIITDSEQAERLSSLDMRTIVVDDGLMSSLPPYVSEPACSTVTVDNVSWVVFTSGSTGTPKGSILEHGALASSLLKHSRMLRLTAQSRALQFAAFTFDNSISDIFATLFQGGCVCEPSEHDRVSNLAQVVWDLRVNVLSLTPTVAALLRPQDVPPIDTLIVGGEPLDPNVIDIWGKSSAIINSYGPSECSILVACSRPLVERRDAPNVGLPVACCFWIVSPTDINQLCPIGAPGELLLQGPQLGRGYINEPEKTAQAFVMNPRWVEKFPSARNQRLYRSGDLVRQNPDQSITMLGRRDMQVKIHGQRVEIGEIESWIVRLMPDVRKAAVDYITLAHGRSDRVLVAALELNTEKLRDVPVQVSDTSLVLRHMLEKLRTDLRDVLPSYMIPNIFLPVTRLPLNPSSKLDRLALRTVLATLSVDDWNRHLINHATTKSVMTETETLLRQLWSTVMSMDETLIGRDDNLFDLGGDSVVAMRLTALAREAGLQLTVADMFQNPVLEQMASIASKAESVAPSLGGYQPFSFLDDQQTKTLTDTIKSLPWIKSTGVQILDIAPVTDFQALSVAGMLSEARMDVNYIAIDGKGYYDVDELIQALMMLIDKVEILRTAFVQDGGQFWQVLLSEYDPRIQVYQTSESIDSFTGKFILEEKFGSLQLGKPPLDIAIIATEQGDEHRILFRMSHALYDAHSLPMIWDSLMEIYRGSDVKSYPTFTSYLFDLYSRTNESSLSYWRDLLRGSVMPPLGQSQVTRIELKASSLPVERLILPSSIAAGMMPAVAVKAAWGIVLSQHSGLLDIVFAETSTGRNAVSPDVASAYGCTVTALPFRFVVSRDESVSELLDRIREQQTESIRHETISTQRIVANYAEWSRYTSLINHQRVQRSRFTLGKTEYTQSFIMPPDGFYMTTNISIAATQGPGWLEVGLSYAVDLVSREVALSLFHDLRVAIDEIASKPNAAVASIKEAVRARQLGNVGGG